MKINKAMNTNNLTIKSQEVLQKAYQIALEKGQQAIEPGHFMKALLDVDENVTPFVFKKLGVNYQAVRQAVDSIVDSYAKVNGGQQYLSRSGAEIIQQANIYLKQFKDEYIALEHLLLAILKVF